MSEPEKNIAETVKSIVEAGQIKMHSIPELTPGPMFAFVPQDHSIVDLELYMEAPTRIRVRPSFDDVESFAAYSAVFGDKDTIQFANLETKKIVTIFDYHQKTMGSKDRPQWLSHRASLICKHSDEWNIWLGQNKAPMDQPEFANFIENNLPDIIEPVAAEMLEMVLDVANNTSVTFKSKYSLADGRIQMEYAENKIDSGTKHMDLPALFVINIPVFLNGPMIKIGISIRNRIREGKLVLWFEIKQPHKIMELAFRDIVSSVKEATGRDILLGTI